MSASHRGSVTQFAESWLLRRADLCGEDPGLQEKILEQSGGAPASASLQHMAFSLLSPKRSSGKVLSIAVGGLQGNRSDTGYKIIGICYIHSKTRKSLGDLSVH